jgi:hypothetical protein
MQKKIRVVSARKDETLHTIELISATYEDSEPFSGVFQISDPDMTFYVNPETGRTRVPVICYFGTKDGEDDSLVFEVNDVFLQIFEDNPGDVVERIDWAV